MSSMHALSTPDLGLRIAALIAVGVGTLGPSALAQVGGAALAYDIIYVRQARFGDNENTTWPEVFHPGRIDPGADLMLLHPDGTEEVLVAGGDGAVTDPFVSFDAQWVYYALFHDVRPSQLNYQREFLSEQGADIFRIHLASRQVEQLTHGEFWPNTGAGNWDESNPLDPPPGFNRLGYGILNLGPAPLPGGKVAFTSNRHAYIPPKGFTNPTMQVFVMDEDGSNVTAIAPMTISSALHPTPLRDGRLMFSTHESQGLRDERLWGIWTIQPDGRDWRSLVSAFNPAQAFHFMTQLSGGDLVVVDYYNLNNNGFGALYRFPEPPAYGEPAFFPAFLSQNPAITQTVGGGFVWPLYMHFSPLGIFSISPMTTGADEGAPVGKSGVRVGKFTHPSAAPNNDLLVVWSPGPCNDLNRPTPKPYYDAGLYLIPGAQPVNDPSELVLIKNDPAYNEAWPRAVVAYSAVHGVAEPATLPWLPNDGTLSARLPAGTPLGIVGSSSVYKRESFPGMVQSWSNTFDGLDAFNSAENNQSSNWFTQGADAGKYSNSDIWAVRLVAMEPNTHRSYGPNEGRHFWSHANERLRVLGEIPLRKFDAQGQAILDPEGNPDTSFAAIVPGDTPFTFQTIDKHGAVLNMAQTWHQVRPGEVRTNCGGCHAHSQAPLDFSKTQAGMANFAMFDLSKETPVITKDAPGDPGLNVVNAPVVNVEFYQNIRPILEQSCVQCHTKADPKPPGNLVLDDTAIVPGTDRLPGDYARLAADDGAKSQWGHPPLVKVGGDPVWRYPNASRYVRKFQSRRSLLVWKILGERIDGWTNGDHPTEAVPGDASTLPAGATIGEADLDFVGTIMPPPASGVPALTPEQRLTIVRWIDLGCPINNGASSGDGDFGWFMDDLRPTLELSLPRPGVNTSPVTGARLGLVDAASGIDVATLSVKASFAAAGRPAGAELGDLAAPIADRVWWIDFGGPLSLPPGQGAHVYASVKDEQGHIVRVDRRFALDQAPCPPDCDSSGTLNIDDFICFQTRYAIGDPSADCDASGGLNIDDFICFQTAFAIGC